MLLSLLKNMVKTKSKVKPNDTIHKNIESFINKLSVLFGVSGYVIKVLIKDDTQDSPYADIISDDEYQTLYINVYKTLLNESDDEIKKTLLHELCHTVTYNQMAISFDLLNGKLHTKQETKIESEKATSKIENLIDRLFKNPNIYKVFSDFYVNAKIK